MALTLTNLFNQTLVIDALPEDCSQSVFMPLHMKWSKQAADNYQLISFTSIVCKLMERLTKATAMGDFNHSHVSFAAQYSFLKGRSCLANLLSILQLVSRWVDEGKSVDYFI